MKQYRQFTDFFIVPAVVVCGIVAYLLSTYVFHEERLAIVIILAATLLGCIDLLRHTITSLIQKKFALDYIALLAIATSIVSSDFLVAAVIALMLASGQTLEKYAVARARKALTALTKRIPDSVLLWEHGDIGEKAKIEEVAIGQSIFVRKGEVIPLDGLLVSDDGLADESSLTGEPYEMEKIRGDIVRSGTINIGKPMVIRVTQSDKDSTYRKIINMVRQAEEEQSPIIRLADRYSTVFTIITLAITAFAYAISKDLHQALAVLVIATPCPLILATPIALIGGMNALARRKVIVKNLTSIEALSRVTDIMFDKTGTLTLGRPYIVSLDIKKKQYTKNQILSIAEAIERNSLHPLAKAVVEAARANKVKRLAASSVHETVGSGIEGKVGYTKYHLTKVKGTAGFAIEMRSGGVQIAVFHFEDRLKYDAGRILRQLKSTGLKLHIFTGDKKESTDQIISQLGGIDIAVASECSPEDKMRGIRDIRRNGGVTAMVGDGINDAPALAASDVGMVFSSEEQTAASEAADMVFLGGDFSLVLESLAIANRTIGIALQSIWFGIGLSITGMIAAAFGFIPPIWGAFIQEAIDVSVIINALRASR